MTKASDNVFPRFLISEGGSTSTPAANQVTVYAKANGLLYQKDDAGVETLLAGQGFHGARATAGAVTSLTNNAYTSIAFSTETYDTDAYHDTSTNNSRLTIPAGLGGYYAVTALACFAASGNATQRGAKILINATTSIAAVIYGIDAWSASALRFNISDIYALAAGDYIELQQFQDSGGAIDSTTATTLALAFLGA